MCVLVPFLQYLQTLFYQGAMTTLSACMILGLMLQCSILTMVLQLRVFCSFQQVACSYLQVWCFIITNFMMM